jgi:ferritin-like metal-binding protein YciE
MMRPHDVRGREATTITERPMPELKNLHDLFLHELKDALSAEEQLAKALPKMAERADSEALRSALSDHLEQTREHAGLISELLGAMDAQPKAEHCEAMAGIIKEAKSMLEAKAAPAVLDAAIIASAQKAEHYEIATYGTLREWAEQMGHDDAVETLGRILGDEIGADEKLTEVARTINSKADKNAKAKQA